MAQSLRSQLVLYSKQVSFWLTFAVSSWAILTMSAKAQSLQDPTRPATSATVLSSNAEGEVAATGPVLQSVLISAKRKMAMIDGQVIALNGKFGDQVLVQIHEGEVVLQRGKEMQTLRLFPDFEKKMNHKDNKHKQDRKPNKKANKQMAGES